jgi:hypothetical protein
VPDLDIGNGNNGFVDKRQGRGQTGAPVQAEQANFASISTMKTRLAALAAGSYTTARLNTMSDNDLVYALRVASADAAGI